MRETTPDRCPSPRQRASAVNRALYFGSEYSEHAGGDVALHGWLGRLLLGVSPDGIAHVCGLGIPWQDPGDSPGVLREANGKMKVGSLAFLP